MPFAVPTAQKLWPSYEAAARHVVSEEPRRIPSRLATVAEVLTAEAGAKNDPNVIDVSTIPFMSTLAITRGTCAATVLGTFNTPRGAS